MRVRRNAALILVVVVSILGGCAGRPLIAGAESARHLTHPPAAKVLVKGRCRVGAEQLAPAECVAFARFVRQLALARFFEALWRWDNPPAPGFSSWACVGSAETGNDFAAHGSEYSSAFGMMNAAVRERADDPASAARIMAGTASAGEQRRAAWREDLAFGPSAWGLLTRAKCAI